MSKFASARKQFRYCKSNKNEACIRRMSKKQKKAYRIVVKNAKLKNRPEWILNGYYLTDINKDGVADLILKTGDCEANMEYDIYTYKKGKAVYLDSIGAGHSGLYYYPSGNGMIKLRGTQGYEEVSLVTIRGSRVYERTINARDYVMNSGGYINMPYALSSHSKYANIYYGWSIDYRQLQ